MWIKSDCRWGTHPQTIRFARLLGIPGELAAAVGYLHFLFWWAQEYAPDGNLSEIGEDELCEICHYRGAVSIRQALCGAGFLTPGGRLRYFELPFVGVVRKMIPAGDAESPTAAVGEKEEEEGREDIGEREEEREKEGEPKKTEKEPDFIHSLRVCARESEPVEKCGGETIRQGQAEANGGEALRTIRPEIVGDEALRDAPGGLSAGLVSDAPGDRDEAPPDDPFLQFPPEDRPAEPPDPDDPQDAEKRAALLCYLRKRDQVDLNCALRDCPRVFISRRQFDDLCRRLSLPELEIYLSRLESELQKGRKITRQYDYILNMAQKERALRKGNQF